ncbi:hypothetical protein ACFE04_012256 [Oxalis oulophora]
MDALRRQASKLKEQVAKQHQLQAMMKQFSTSGYESSDVMVIDEIEMHTHHQLDKLYSSTRSGKEFQKEFIKAAELFTALGYKQIEAGTKFSEDCCNFGADNVNDNILAKAASLYGDARKHMEKEVQDLNRLLSSQILEPLRSMVNGASLDDARHLAQRYSKMRHEAEAQLFVSVSCFESKQAVEVSKRQLRVREAPIPENVAKLQVAEAKMKELKANMAVLGKEAAAALTAVEAQQQRLTFQRLVALVEGEKNHHLRLAAILADVEAEMVTEKQHKESALPVIPSENGSDKTSYFLAEAVQAFDAETEKELSLAVGDYVVVRKVSPSGWSEGECKGKAGWFPSSHVERRRKIPDNINMSAEAF